VTDGEKRLILEHLFSEGPSTDDALQRATGNVDQIGPNKIAEWAREEGLIEPVTESTGRRRWQITDAGHRWLGDNPPLR
jgi:hypothetical protein